MNFEQLVAKLEALEDFDSNIDTIHSLMNSYTSLEEEWKKYCFVEQGCYTRNLVLSTKAFNLMILCWDSKVISPIHDHSKAHCILKVLKGELNESLYDWNVNLSRNVHLEENQVAYMHDKIGLHSVDNPSATTPSVSLHLYSPPFDYCKTFCPRTKEARLSGKCIYYSEEGKKIALTKPALRKMLV